VLRRKIACLAVVAAFGVIAAPAAQASSDPFASPLFANTNGLITAGGCTGLLGNLAGQESGGADVGFTTVVPHSDGNVVVQVHLRNAAADTTYLFTRACIGSPVAFLTTNDNGVGNGTLVAPQNGPSWVVNGGPVDNIFGPDFFASNVITFPDHGS